VTGEPNRKPEKEEEKKDCICEARIRAFMRMLRIKEGTEGESGYKKRYGGIFTDMKTHPQIKITSGGYTSSACSVSYHT
jgi:muramidase (phage lysozyme)